MNNPVQAERLSRIQGMATGALNALELITDIDREGLMGVMRDVAELAEDCLQAPQEIRSEGLGVAFRAGFDAGYLYGQSSHGAVCQAEAWKAYGAGEGLPEPEQGSELPASGIEQ